MDIFSLCDYAAASRMFADSKIDETVRNESSKKRFLNLQTLAVPGFESDLLILPKLKGEVEHNGNSQQGFDQGSGSNVDLRV